LDLAPNCNLDVLKTRCQFYFSMKEEFTKSKTKKNKNFLKAGASFMLSFAIMLILQIIYFCIIFFLN